MATRRLAIIARQEAAYALAREATGGGGGGGDFSNPNWLVPNWYIDASNATGHASDNNDGQTPLTPVLTWRAILNKLGTTSPILPQNTVFHFLSDHTSITDPVILTPYTINFALVGLQGSLIATGVTGNLAGVVPKNRATAQLLEANIGTPAAAQQGFILENITKGARCWIDGSAGGNVAILTQPMASITTTLPVRPPLNPAMIDTFANLDAFRILRPVKVNLVQFQPSPSEDTDSSFDFYYGFIEQIWGIDPSPVGPGQSTGIFSPDQVVYEARFDRFNTVDNLPGDVQLVLNNTWNAGSGNYFSTALQGGSMNPLLTFGSVFNGGSTWDADCIIHGGVDVGVTVGGSVFPALCYLARDGFNELNVRFAGVVRISVEAYGLAIVWGPADIQAAAGGKVFYDTSATANIQITGTLKLDGTNNGNAFNRAAGTWAAQTTITVAHLDAADGKALVNPETHSGFAQYVST